MKGAGQSKERSRGSEGDAETTVEVWLAGARHEIRLEAGETIFAAAHRVGLELPFSCLGGYCGECMATLEAGDADMRVSKNLSPRQLERGLILTCQAVPRGGGCRVRFGR